MAERVLPSRERAAEILAQRGIQRVDGDNVLEAYAKGELQTEAERREAIDYEAAGRLLSGLIFQSADDVSPGEFDDYADKEARRIVDVALPDQGT